QLSALYASNPFSLFPLARAFFAASSPAEGVTADREEFYGVGSSRREPAALGRRTLSGRAGAGLDPCAALHVKLRLAPGERASVSFVLGHGDSHEHAERLVRAHTAEGAADAALAASARLWE